MGKVQIEIRTHQGFEEWERATEEKHKIQQLFVRHQFIYKRNSNEISLVELKDPFTDKWYWEIYCGKGGIFEGTQKFNFKQEADNKIMALLTPEEQL